MKEQKKVVTTTANVTVYIAEDGTEFRNERECRQYEAYMYRQQISSLYDNPDIETLEGDDDFPHTPVIEWDPPLSATYHWFKPRTEEACEAIRKVFGENQIEIFVDEWNCVRDWDREFSSVCLHDVFLETQEFFETFGLKITMEGNV